jgi:hypothetical protein
MRQNAAEAARFGRRRRQRRGHNKVRNCRGHSDLLVMFVASPQHVESEPADAASCEVVGEVGPVECRAEDCRAQEVAPQRFQKRRMPKLEELEDARCCKHASCDLTGVGPRQDQRQQQAPEDFVKNAVERVVPPVRARASVELAL